MRSRTGLQRVIAGASALLLTLSLGAAAETAVQPESGDTAPVIDNVADRPGYAEYHRTPGFELTGQSVAVELSAATLVKGASLLSEYEGYTGPVILTEEDSEVTFAFHVPATGRYRVLVEYYPVESSSQSIERTVELDGEICFSEAVCIEFPRVFTDVPYPGENDPALRPQQVETRRWLSAYCADSVGYFTNLYWNIDAGAHTLTLTGMREPMAIKGITLLSDEDPVISYEEYLQQHGDAAPVSGVLTGGWEKYQAEDMLEKSSPTLYAQNDKSSAGTEPHDLENDVLNYVGGAKWTAPGQWISWEITVPESGYYNIALRCRQNTERGMLTHRRILLDGELPFAEAADVTFRYSGDWQVVKLGNADGAFRFWLTAGHTYTLTMEAVLGSLTETLSEASETLDALNEINWSLMTVLG
ncbi:MAG: hypothetical protein IJZ13_03040, partial [Clostridia bacterium]|nr:hypothetical protein [Clostridia bacterium]